MVKRIVLKVDIPCKKCKKKIIHAVSVLEGVDKIEFDAARSTLTVIGNADPIEVIVRVRKAGKFAEVVSIGPLPMPPQPQKPGPDAQKKLEEKKPPPVKAPEKKPEPPKAIVHVPMTCQVCQQMGEDHHLSCSIM